MSIERVAVLGAGTIGASWAALFLAAGKQVTVFEPSDGAEARVRAAIDAASGALSSLGWAQAGDVSALRFVDDPAAATAGADFVQENAPELPETKRALYARIEPALSPSAIIGSSTSGVTLSALQAGLQDPSRLIIAHPFNPPHLIPLVEIVANARTAPDVAPAATAFYESLGKVVVTLQKEVVGHIANRLQAALWREAIHLAASGVASVEDIDKAVAHGPGLRWAALGPTALFHLGGGAGGIRQFCEHLGEPVASWWRDLGAPELTPEIVDLLAEGMATAGDAAALAARRDALILRQLEAQKALDEEGA